MQHCFQLGCHCQLQGLPMRRGERVMRSKQASWLYGLVMSAVLLHFLPGSLGAAQVDECNESLSFSKPINNNLSLQWQRHCPGSTQTLTTFSPVATDTLLHQMDKALHGIEAGLQQELLFQWDYHLTADIYQTEADSTAVFRLTDANHGTSLILSREALVALLQQARQLRSSLNPVASAGATSMIQSK